MFLFLFLFFSMLLLCSFFTLTNHFKRKMIELSRYFNFYYLFFENAKNLGRSDDANRRKKKVDGLINFNMPFQLVLTKLNCFRVYRKSDHVTKSCKEAIGHDVAVAQFVCISRTCDFPRNFTAVTTSTRPQRFFSSVQTCGLVDVNQPLPRFSRFGQEKILSLFLEHSEEHAGV